MREWGEGETAGRCASLISQALLAALRGEGEGAVCDPPGLHRRRRRVDEVGLATARWRSAMWVWSLGQGGWVGDKGSGSRRKRIRKPRGSARDAGNKVERESESVQLTKMWYCEWKNDTQAKKYHHQHSLGRRIQAEAYVHGIFSDPWWFSIDQYTCTTNTTVAEICAPFGNPGSLSTSMCTALL